VLDDSGVDGEDFVAEAAAGSPGDASPFSIVWIQPPPIAALGWEE
jgi:hypothetical protein